MDLDQITHDYQKALRAWHFAWTERPRQVGTIQRKERDWETKETEIMRDGRETSEEKDQVVYPALVELIEEAEDCEPEDAMAGLITEWARILTRLEEDAKPAEEAEEQEQEQEQA